MPEAFHLREITQSSPNNMSVSFINKKARYWRGLMRTYYLEQQHTFLQQVHSQPQLQDLPFIHPLQEHLPLQHLQSISQQGSLLLFIILSNIFHQIYPTLHKQKSPREEAILYIEDNTI